MTRIQFVVQERDRRPRRVAFSKPLITIGRSSASDLQIAGDEVSGRHARLRVYGEYATLEDLGSTNGTFIDDAPVHGEAEIGLGSVVRFGEDGPTVIVEAGLPALTATAVSPSARRSDRDSSSDAAANRHGVLWVSVAAIAVCLLVASGAIGATLIYVTTPVSDGAIASVKDEERLADSVGLVIGGWEMNGPQGQQFLRAKTGTGFAISHDGYLITNNHVIEEPRDIPAWLNEAFAQLRSEGNELRYSYWVAFDGDIYDAQIVHRSRNQDLCVIKADRHQSSVFALSTSEKMPRVSDVFALGFPGAAMDVGLSEIEDIEIQTSKETLTFVTDLHSAFKPRDFDFVLTQGIVSRTQTEKNGSLWVQHDTAISHGNSGGPLCLESGVVVAVNTRINPNVSGNSFSFLVSQYREELDGVVEGIHWRD